YTKARIFGDYESKEPVFVEQAERIEDVPLVLIDDALAEGTTGQDFGEGLLTFKPSKMDLVVTLSKRMQKGRENLLNSRLFNTIVEAISVEEVTAPGSINGNVTFAVNRYNE